MKGVPYFGQYGQRNVANGGLERKDEKEGVCHIMVGVSMEGGSNLLNAILQV